MTEPASPVAGSCSEQDASGWGWAGEGQATVAEFGCRRGGKGGSRTCGGLREGSW